MTRLIAAGRDADVFAIDAGRVLRRYRDGGDVAVEAAAMVHLAGHGFPVPAVYRAEGADLVMARVPGPTMLTALRDAEIELVRHREARTRYGGDQRRVLHAAPGVLAGDDVDLGVGVAAVPVGERLHRPHGVG